jgi:hypothetical protein
MGHVSRFLSIMSHHLSLKSRFDFMSIVILHDYKFVAHLGTLVLKALPTQPLLSVQIIISA